MKDIKVLDCTLRDGGYINEWDFGVNTIDRIIGKLADSNIDIIECGFLRDDEYDVNKSVFNDVLDIEKYIKNRRKDVMYVAMIDQPYIPLEKIRKRSSETIDGIRLTFHEDETEINQALEYGKRLMEKGYEVFIQPVGTATFSDESLLKLIKRVNNLKPYAFYLVDTLGSMYKNNLLRIYYLLDNNLERTISIGFHSHNNLQLSFSNAQELIMLQSKRNLIIDSSVFGMGRGAGNLCTELATHYINENIEQKYDIVPLLEIYDEHLSKITNQVQWGYSVHQYLAAASQCHPNYSSYLMNKQTLTVKYISKILSLLPSEKKHIFDKEIIENLYIQFQDDFVDDYLTLGSLEKVLNAKQEVLIMAPGATIISNKNEIIKYIEMHKPYIISVNFIPEDYKVDATFISNHKRYNTTFKYDAENMKDILIINTSNIEMINSDDNLTVNYSDLLFQDPIISDNAGVMLINLLKKISIKSISLAGFDGYSIEKEKNYFTRDLSYNIQVEELEKNKSMRSFFKMIRKKVGIKFITRSIYEIKE
ncbi:aldolase catalytic domain-containing protein [Tissierella sp. Yu-01]|uniref:aldolase catalytic domain-containing protein n=1 Tax=Tissierella sp. Yu-01 TaxID=3035694 RepID=UPI00240E2894|nr:aldolase catalytic domain-containing protein [Tissierella sp. Yu-01]WFA07912.1 aldolase catalytic domain-containing protein [Tissierella sp. Yu-01]